MPIEDDLTQGLDWLREEGSIPKQYDAPIDGVVFTLASSLDAPGSSEELQLADRLLAPPDLREFWSRARAARLFEDLSYGQWGLVIWSPALAAMKTDRAKRQRPHEYRQGDLLVGEFLGDSDLVLVRCDAVAADYGSVLVAWPIDSRPAWPVAARSFTEFIGRFVSTHGAKYWSP